MATAAKWARSDLLRVELVGGGSGLQLPLDEALDVVEAHRPVCVFRAKGVYRGPIAILVEAGERFLARSCCRGASDGGTG